MSTFYRPLARRLRTLAFALPLICAPAASHAVELQMASGYPDTNFLTQTVQAFIDDVAKRTNGDVKITLHSNQTLVKLPDMIRAVQTQQVALADVRLGNYGNDDPVYVVDAIPDLAGNYDSALKLWAASKPYLTDSFAKRGLKVLFAMWNPPQGFYTKKPLETSEDFKGLKMRIYSTGTSTMAGLLGAAPKEVPFSEVAQGFSTGLINSMFTSPQTGIDTQAWDFTSNLTMVGAVFTKQLVSINADVFDGLPKADQDAILAAAADAEKNGFALMQSLAKKQQELIASKGMKVTEANDAIHGAMKKVGATMLESWMKSATPEQAAVVTGFQAM